MAASYVRPRLGLTNRLGYMPTARQAELVKRYLTHVLNMAMEDEPQGDFTVGQWKVILKELERIRRACDEV